MLGKLDPEERIMEDIIEPYSRYLEFSQVDEIKQLFDEYGWKASDDIVIEMNKDAFIVIKNQSRRGGEKSD